ncbi:hypothetical protein [Herbidospora cretacea]|uniref:restriction system modified-DNA reader domain-containing protein n=1 Tax=Herbidospora cretacea TaxID=28444 RepID=UPI0014724F7A|nr:hypothetical protein [Herbidospora cretacea]
MAVVERSHTKQLHEAWDAPGVYILLDRPTPEGTWGAYVGKAAPSTLSKRLVSHLRNRDHWYRALLVRRDTEDPFHTSQVGWLEGRLYDVFAQAELVQLNNGNRPQDHTMHLDDQLSMNEFLPPILSALHLIGHPLTSPTPTRRSRVKTGRVASVPERSHTFPSPSPAFDSDRGQEAKSRPQVTMLDLMNAGLLRPETRLQSTSRSHLAEATLCGDGRIRYDDSVYDAPSAAGRAVTGYHVNGWRFWGIETDQGIRDLASVRGEFERQDW